jgi:cell division cycle 14
LALASPQHEPIEPILPGSPLYSTLATNLVALKKSDLPAPFKNVLSHFSRRNVGLVVRLNSELYSPSHFTALGINHLDMIFDDGTCPALPMVKKFIKIAHETITVKKKAIAVHCKAGLGRTGCLIGAYLIYRHGFTANEIIAFMRFMRPGMVVGPQQHWLHLNQGTFREWWWEDTIKQKLALVLPSTPTKTLRHRHESINPGQTATPPNGSQQGKRLALGEINHNEGSPPVNVMDENLPAPTPGQPRKAGRMDARHHPYARTASATFNVEKPPEISSGEIVEMRSHRKDECNADESIEEEWELRMLLSQRTSSRSPLSNTSERRRAVSHSTLTTTHTSYCVNEDGSDQRPTSDVENWLQEPHASDKVSRPRTPGVTKTGSGSGTLGVVKMRGSPIRRSAESRDVKSGVRKTSGRVGSVGASRSRS